MSDKLKSAVEAAWTNRELLKAEETQAAIRSVIDLLDAGGATVAAFVAVDLQ